MEVSVSGEFIVFESVNNTLKIKKEHKPLIVEFFEGKVDDCHIIIKEGKISFYDKNKITVDVNSLTMKDHIYDVPSAIIVLTTGFHNLPLDILSTIAEFTNDKDIHKITTINKDFSKELKFVKQTNNINFLTDKEYRRKFVDSHPNLLLDIITATESCPVIDNGITNVRILKLNEVEELGSFDESLVYAEFMMTRFKSVKGLPKTIKEVSFQGCEYQIEDLDHIKNCELFHLNPRDEENEGSMMTAWFHVSLVNFKFLRELSLSNITVEFPAMFEHLVKAYLDRVKVDNISCFANVKDLELENCIISYLEFPRRLTQLKYHSLFLNNMRFGNMQYLEGIKVERFEESEEEVSIEVVDCPNLQVAIFSGIYLVRINECPNIQVLNSFFSNFEGLENLQRLNKVKFYSDDAPSVLLPTHSVFKELNFDGCIPSNLNDISSEVMSISYNGEDLDISTIHCIRELKLKTSMMLNLGLFANINKLNLSQCDIMSDSLYLIKDVNHLILSNCKLVSIDKLEGGNVQTLIVQRNKILVIPILPNLTYLDATNNFILTIPVLPVLTKLELVKNHISEISLLPKLEYVDLSANNLSSLETLRDVHTVIIKNCKLRSLEGLGNNHFVDCGTNKITDLTPVRNVPIVRASHNKIKNADVMANANELDLRYNPVESYDALKNVKKLRRN